MIVNHIDTRDLAKLRGLRSRLHNGQRVPTFDELRDIAETMLVILNRVESVEITEERAIAAEARAEVERLKSGLESAISARSRWMSEAERLTYELKRWKEVNTQRPDWETLWAEQSARAETAEAEVERLTKDRDAIKMQLDPYVSEVEKLRSYEQTHIENLNAVREKLLLSDVTLQFVSVALGGPDEWSTHETMISSVRRTAEAAKAEVERLTKERDTYKASWEQLTVEKAQSSWGEFQRQGRMLKEVENLRDSWKERAEALEAQVKRLLAKDAERIGRALSEESQ